MDTESQEFGLIKSTTRDERCWNPNRYNKTILKVRSALKKEQTVLLSEVAKIIRPRPDSEKKYTQFCAMPSNWQYPLDYDKLREGVLTDCALKKGDIVFLDRHRMFLVYDDPCQDIHTSPNCFVIRPQNISPEYLYMYLQSDTAQMVMESVSVGTIVQRVRGSDLSATPIIIPTRENKHYERIFQTQAFHPQNIATLNATLYENCSVDAEDCIEDILNNEYITKLRVYCEEVKDRVLEEDIKEINVCFRNKAYKAALILTGSVLEAVLLDWLSELHGKNYFEEDYYDYTGTKGNLSI